MDPEIQGNWRKSKNSSIFKELYCFFVFYFKVNVDWEAIKAEIKKEKEKEAKLKWFWIKKLKFSRKNSKNTFFKRNFTVKKSQKV